MRPYKIIARILIILPIINFAFALPVAVQETRQVYADVVPDVAITTSAKRGANEQMEKPWDMYSERFSRKPGSDQAGPRGLQNEAPDRGSMDPPQTGTSKIQQPELSNSPSLDHYQKSPFEASLDHYVTPPSNAPMSLADHFLASPPNVHPSLADHFLASPPNVHPSLADHFLASPPNVHPSLADHFLASPPNAPTSPVGDHPVSTVSKSPGSSGSSLSMTNLPTKKLTFKSFLGNMFSKLKLWRRTSGPGSVRDAMNAAQRELQGLVGTGARVVRDIGKSLTSAARGVRQPAPGKPS